MSRNLYKFTAVASLSVAALLTLTNFASAGHRHHRRAQNNNCCVQVVNPCASGNWEGNYTSSYSTGCCGSSTNYGGQMNYGNAGTYGGSYNRSVYDNGYGASYSNSGNNNDGYNHNGNNVNRASSGNVGAGGDQSVNGNSAGNVGIGRQNEGQAR